MVENTEFAVHYGRSLQKMIFDILIQTLEPSPVKRKKLFPNHTSIVSLGERFAELYKKSVQEESRFTKEESADLLRQFGAVLEVKTTSGQYLEKDRWTAYERLAFVRYRDRTTYKGGWSRGKRTGYGEHNTPDNSPVYRGWFQNDLYEGKGKKFGEGYVIRAISNRENPTDTEVFHMISELSIKVNSGTAEKTGAGR